MSRAAILEVRRELERLLKEHRSGQVATEAARVRVSILAEIVKTHELEARLEVISDIKAGRGDGR